MFSNRRSCCFLCQTQNHSSVRVTTSRKQERTQEERSVLLNNNRWICLLPFARKPDPGRVSKQVSRELPQAWLFGLVRLAPQAERKAPQAEFSAPQASQFSAPQARKFTRSLRSPCSSRSVFARAALAEQHLRLLVVHKGGPPREGASFSCSLYTRKRLWLFFSFTHPPPRGHAGQATPTDVPLSSRGVPGRPSVALRGRRR